MGVKYDTEKITDILEASFPSNVTQWRSLLGLEGYIQHFIRKLSDGSVVLHAATSLRKAFV